MKTDPMHTYIATILADLRRNGLDGSGPIVRERATCRGYRPDPEAGTESYAATLRRLTGGRIRPKTEN